MRRISLSRFPTLVRDEHDDINGWNRLCDPLSIEIDDLLADVLTDHRFKRQHWLWKPVWYWPDINKRRAHSRNKGSLGQ